MDCWINVSAFGPRFCPEACNVGRNSALWQVRMYPKKYALVRQPAGPLGFPRSAASLSRVWLHSVTMIVFP
ncbi:MAG: hypothetical protein QOE03_2241 [Micromonosporaceae bacterium]|nr:hypothetical protein [Micromonosporaceae bacterium]